MDFGSVTPSFSSAEMEQLFQITFGPQLKERGFTYAGKSRWTRQTPSGFKHLFYLYPFRPGADYYPHAGLSFDCVPRVEAGHVKVRCEPKYARVHLTVSRTVLCPEFSIQRDRSTARERSVEVADASIPKFDLALGQVRTMNDAILAFERDKKTESRGFFNFPERALAYAFALATAGRAKDAEAEFEQLVRIQSRYFSTAVVATLRELLNQAAIGK